MRSDFTVALHIMGCLTAAEGAPLSSEILARTYGTNAVVIRRVLLKLSDAGIVQSQRGVGGGTVLAHSPSEVTLRDVFEAVEGKSEILPRYPEDDDNLSKVLGAYINDLMVSAEAELLARFDSLSIAEMDKAVRPSVRKLLKNRFQ